MESKIVQIKDRLRAKAANTWAFQGRMLNDEFGDVVAKLGNAMVENDAVKEECARQNTKATRSIMIIKTIGSA